MNYVLSSLKNILNISSSKFKAIIRSCIFKRFLFFKINNPRRITINDFCTTWGSANALSGQGEAVNFDDAKMQAFLQGYESKRALSDDEKKALPVMLAMAGVTFWLLRLNVIYYNRQQGRTGDNIMVKNPDLMKRLASFHWGKVK